MNIYQHKVSIFNQLQITKCEFSVNGEQQDHHYLNFKRHHVINKSIKQIVTYFVCQIISFVSRSFLIYLLKF